MEKRLEDLIGDLEQISNVRNLDANNPIVLRISNPTNSTVHAIVCAINEPTTLVLPINVTWVVLDPLSTFYRMALQRVSKDTTAPWHQTWQVLDTFDSVWVPQTYDSADQAQLGVSNAGPSPAQVTVAGIARLSTPAAVASNPVVVSDTDPRLTDARTPLPHTHPEVPATQLRTSSGIVTISGSDAPINGATLVATSATTAVWRKLQTTDLV